MSPAEAQTLERGDTIRFIHHDTLPRGRTPAQIERSRRLKVTKTIGEGPTFRVCTDRGLLLRPHEIERVPDEEPQTTEPATESDDRGLSPEGALVADLLRAGETAGVDRGVLGSILAANQPRD